MAAFESIIVQLEYAERQVRNARMEDACASGDQDPYEFWIATADASLIGRAQGATQTAADLCGRLLDNQPTTEAP